MGMYTLLYLRWITKKALLHRGLCSRLCGSLDGGGVWRRMDTCTGTLAAPSHSQVNGCTCQLVVHPWENGPEEEATTDNGSRLSTARAGILGSWVPGL